MVPAFHFIRGISYSKGYSYSLIGFGFQALRYVKQFHFDVPRGHRSCGVPEDEGGTARGSSKSKEAAGKREAESSGEKKYRVHGQPGGPGPLLMQSQVAEGFLQGRAFRNGRLNFHPPKKLL